MKTLISLALILSSSTLWAATAPKAPNCPRGTESLLRCVLTPQEGDSENVNDLFQGISLCQAGSKYVMAFKDIAGKTNSGDVSAEVRMGGTTFLASEDGVEFKFSVVSGTGRPTTTAKFSVQTKGLSGTTTYTCQ